MTERTLPRRRSGTRTAAAPRRYVGSAPDHDQPAGQPGGAASSVGRPGARAPARRSRHARRRRPAGRRRPGRSGRRRAAAPTMPGVGQPDRHGDQAGVAVGERRADQPDVGHRLARAQRARPARDRRRRRRGRSGAVPGAKSTVTRSRGAEHRAGRQVAGGDEHRHRGGRRGGRSRAGRRPPRRRPAARRAGGGGAARRGVRAATRAADAASATGIRRR